jgi:rod shape-determining protein MreC
MFKRPHYISLGLVGLLTLIVLNLPQHATGQIKLAIGSLFLPLFGLSKSSQDLVSRAADAALPRSELISQNEELRRENESLKARAAQLDALLRENSQLRDHFGWEHQQPWKLRLASVIARDPANWWHVVVIDAGSREGIRTNMPAMTSEGLVGRVSAVGYTTSQVSLIGNPDCKVSALVVTGDKSGDTGVITGGATALDNSLVTLSFLSANNNIRPGQRVVASGQGGVFKKGLVIGQVAEEPRVGDLGYAEARVKLAANPGAMEEIWVVLQ